MPDGSRRGGFRHELVSTLALFSVLQRHEPDHPALRGPYRTLLEKLPAVLPGPTSPEPPTPLEQEILALDRRRFDLLAWLVCTHHGKVRMAWHASPADQKASDDQLRIRGVREGDVLPPLALADAHGAYLELPASALDLSPAAAGLNSRTGPGWTERVLGLLREHGPFTLAWFEALMRAADIRASRQPGLSDPLLSPENPVHGLENRNSRMAQAFAGSADDTSAGTRAGADLAEHGVRARASGPELAQGATRPPDDATRHFDTVQGRLSYTELAERLAEPLLHIEQRIRSGEFGPRSFDQHLLLHFHRELCAPLLPEVAGRYRQTEVRVGAHEPPPPAQVAPLMLDYVRNLETRMQHLPSDPDERWLETLAYAEGALLSIHPFPDLNGRVSRLWLSELLRRLGLPPVDIVPSDPGFRECYLDALAAADRRDWHPLTTLWRERLERPGEQP
jgi:CRISPR-associated endonuclease/helicase Cas3